jgi:hypothetical protein
MCPQYLYHIHPPTPFLHITPPFHWYQPPPPDRTCFTLLFSSFVKIKMAFLFI